MKYVALLLLCVITGIARAQVPDSNRCVMVKVSAICSKTHKAIPNAKVVILSNQGLSIEDYISVDKPYVTCLPNAMYEIQVSAERFYSPDRLGFQITDTTQYIEHTFEMDSLQVSRCMRLPIIYFEKSRCAINDTAKPELNGVVKLLIDNPNITLEIMAYSPKPDSNTKQATCHAETVLQYFVKNGIAADRFTIRKYKDTIRKVDFKLSGYDYKETK